MLAVLRDGFGDSSTAAAPALRMTGGAGEGFGMCGEEGFGRHLIRQLC